MKKNVTKSEKWNKLIGKKVCVIDTDAYNKLGKIVFTGIIEGCDPDIGICITYEEIPGRPFWISHGHLSPKNKDRHWSKERIESQAIIMETMYNQLISGYFSCHVTEEFIGTLHNASNVLLLAGPACPFNM